jgi:hypothetical protein
MSEHTGNSASAIGLTLLLFLQLPATPSHPAASMGDRVGSLSAAMAGTYVGSKVCGSCHAAVYQSFSKTGMGRSMSDITPSLLSQLPSNASIFDPTLNRHFSVFVKQGKLYQSEWETSSDGKDVFRETEPLRWIIGAGANAIGGIIQRGDRLFEAPLTFYEKTQTWGLSPGYEQADRGFSRPIDGPCVFCHSARPNPEGGSAGQFRNPPFNELAIGCETCHGPGAEHVHKMAGGGKTHEKTSGIVNPAEISPWLADNICMLCHQNGDARVLQPDKTLRDFRPGQPLDRTLAILMVPFTRESPPNSDHVQHYFSMTLSKCYRSSAGKLGCITCHDPHVQPAAQDAPGYFRNKCLSCHSETSCTAPASDRQQTTPPDSCIACHMPKRDVTQISHVTLTNHRVVATADEPFPEITFQLTTKSLPDLVHLSAIPDKANDLVSPLTLLQVYGQLAVEHHEYLPRYFEVAKQLETSEPKDVNVLEALASRSLQQKTEQDESDAMDYLKRAIEQGSNSAWDYEQLGAWLIKRQRFSEAAVYLQKGIQRAPYDPKLYAQLAEDYVAQNKAQEATSTLKQAQRIFPQLDWLRGLLNDLEETKSSQQPADSSH